MATNGDYERAEHNRYLNLTKIPFVKLAALIETNLFCKEHSEHTAVT